MNEDHRQQEFYFTLDEFTNDQEVGLAASVILMALRDVRHPTNDARQFAKSLMFRNPKEEVEEFWTTEWGMLLRDNFGLEDVGFAEFVRG